MNEQVKIQRSLPPQVDSPQTWKKTAVGIAIIGVLFTLIGIFAVSSFANVESRTLAGGESLNLRCDGRGFQVERPSGTEMSITCHPAPEAEPTVAPTTAPITQPDACKDVPANVVKNHGFESGKTNWSFHTNGSGNLAIDNNGQCGKAARVKIDAKGTNIQLYQAGLTLEPNTEYVLRFVAKSNTGSDLAVNILKHQKDYRNYGLKKFEADLTSDWQSFEVRFTTTGFSSTVSNGRLQFWLAPYTKAGDHYWIDQVQLVKADAVVVVPPNPIVQPTVAPIIQPPVKTEGTYYVAPHGDNSNPGSQQAPFRTIQHAVNQAKPGETIYVRGGKYVETVRITQSGTADQPITLSAFPGEKPIIDGEYRLPEKPASGWAGCNNTVSPPKCFHYRPLLDIAANYIVVDGFEVRHSLGRGVLVHGGDRRVHHVTIRNMDIHDQRNSGLLMLRVDHVLFDNNRVYNISTFATHDRPGSQLGWPLAVNAVESTNITYSNNEIFNNYGEGIGTGRDSDKVSIINNEIYDNRALNVYIHRTTNVIVRDNNVYCTGNTEFLRGGNRPAGIVVNNEDQFGHMRLVNHAEITGNVVVGCSKGFAMWAGGGTVKVGSSNVLVENNTFVNQDASPGTYEAVAFSIMPESTERNVVIRNNVIHQQKYRVANVPNDPQLTFQSNDWSQMPPDNAKGPGDTYGQLRLVNPDAPVLPGQFNPGAYKIVQGTISGN